MNPPFFRLCVVTGLLTLLTSCTPTGYRITLERAEDFPDQPINVDMVLIPNAKDAELNSVSSEEYYSSKRQELMETYDFAATSVTPGNYAIREWLDRSKKCPAGQLPVLYVVTNYGEDVDRSRVKVESKKVFGWWMSQRVRLLLGEKEIRDAAAKFSSSPNSSN